MRKEKGITLVALIITIIVMLILVAVSVNILIKSNLMGTAKSATEKYKTATEEEGKDGTITIGDKTYNSVEEYLEKSKQKSFTLNISETETKTFSFVEGQTWMDFIGESAELIIDGVEFRGKSEYIEIYVDLATGFIQNSVKVASLELNYKIADARIIDKLYIKDGENRTMVLPTDKIVADGEYCIVSE